jgi:hypothetical protein
MAARVHFIEYSSAKAGFFNSNIPQLLAEFVADF